MDDKIKRILALILDSQKRLERAIESNDMSYIEEATRLRKRAESLLLDDI